jgi:hypothetical protein
LNTTSTIALRALAALLAFGLAAGLAMAAKSISNTGNLAFGRFAAGSGGTITVSHTGVRTRTGAVVLLASPVAPASFVIGDNNQGNSNKVVILTLPANGSVSLAAGPDRMALSNFTTSFQNNGLLAPGAHTVTVGATLTVQPNQRPANYSGSFPVILEFQ